MSLILTLEQSPQQQAVRQMRLVEGELVIGRSADADWRIDDPDMYISRAHCTIACVHGRYEVTDTSSGGLFIDGSRVPLGSGNSAPLHDGARLQLGNYIVRVEVQGTPSDRLPERRPSPDPISFERDTFFSERSEKVEPPPRPAGLPDPFEQPAAGAFEAVNRQEATKSGHPFDDPFSLDPLPAQRQDDKALNLFLTGGPADQPVPDRTAPEQKAKPQSRPDLPPQMPPQASPSTDAGLREAFLRGLGFDGDEFPAADSIAQMESFGREYRMMLEGLIHLLRKRAEEKGEARIAQTVVGASEVNPLKFMPTVDDVIATFLAQRTVGFLPAEAAISGSISDLAHHHVRTWRGVQAALARMIDRFDPAALESELKSQSTWDAVLAGGRRAKLWELYEKRYREIARNASTRFLGEIGSDFRDGYEEREKE
ncbi:type VI secretion protein [Rhizobium leguminosarum bv. trifolii]|uniref:Type VI secretion protein n=1 Tax=Rhizobium leguminosarum bv. trifolii TaxID=386 RepID=A0A1B8R3V8_RHILT|nr:type VI secretion system-associated FHA domain protein TagH [Rhizobium leguminosarum]AOO93879.1 type VI secretion protein [Rhizobium leguminosarum bv. trifolii]OBY03500.1 type VI secretion protein [Rhizobium leguminosarum bv. trifolii]